jgi:hypothetical protein
LLASNDTGLQAVGIGIKSVEAGGRAGRFGVKAIKTSVKRTVGGIKNIGRAFKTLKTLGLKKSVKKLAVNTVKAMAKAFLKLVQKGLMKIVMPAVLIFTLMIAMLAMVSAPIAGVASIFGGVFSTKEEGSDETTDFETDTYLRGKIDIKRAEFAEKAAKLSNDSLVSNNGQYHFVRLFKDEEPDTVLTEVKTGGNSDEIKVQVLDSIEPTKQLADLMNPIFTVMLLQKYDLMPTENQANSTVNELWNTIMRTETSELPLEHCTPEVHSDCGSWLAHSDCPNHTEGTHGSFTCSLCCYVKEHSSTTLNDDGSTSTHTWYTDECHGYSHCDGHKIFAVYIKQDGLYELLNKYFNKPIEELANNPNRTDEQDEKLQELQDNLNLCLDLINEVQGDTTDGAGNVYLSGVEFINGTRTGNQAIVDLARTQIGNVGGQPYWSYFGFTSRIEWCATFVSCCARNCAISTDVVPTNFSLSGETGVKWWKDRGQWYAGNYTEPVAGDLIFFNWDSNQSGKAQHVGLVAGNDGEKVYIIDGNYGDACRSRSYPLTSSVIYGYALPNY